MTTLQSIEEVIGGSRGGSSRESLDHPSYNCPAGELVQICQHLRDNGGFDMLVDVSGVDWGVKATPRFGAFYHLFQSSSHQYLRLYSACVSDGESFTLPSLSGLWPGADWHERETYDMFGIIFTGHPNLKRILMWDEYPYFPLRKDFPLAGIDTPLPDDEVTEATKASVKPAPMAGGPFVSPQRGAMSEREPRAKDESWTEKREKPVI